MFALQVAVGIGTLAGSTIMLLTIAWGGSLLVGRCDIERVRRARNPHPLSTRLWAANLRIPSHVANKLG